MRSLLDRLVDPLHLLVALACTWLLASSPWLGMYAWIPDEPGFVDATHVTLGLALVPLAALYVAACSAGGRWRQFFPWLAGETGALRSDLRGLARGERPGAEGGGLFATVEGLLLLALAAAAATGAMWFALRGTDAAVAWRSVHLVAARAFGILMLTHVAAVSLHLVDLVRD
jgi:hypothetical protein